MRALAAMMHKEVLHIGRDIKLIVFVVSAPIVIVLLFGYGLRLTIEHLPVAVYDQERTYFSAAVLDRLRRSPEFAVVEADSEGRIREWLGSGRARVGLVIPRGFTERMMDNEQTVFPVLVDGTMPTVAVSVLYGMRLLTEEDGAAELRFEDPDHPAPPSRKPPIKIAQEILFNPGLRDSDFFLPGTLGMVTMMVALLLSMGVVREREEKTMEQLMVTPMPRLTLMVGKLFPCGVFAVADFWLVLGIASLVFGLPLRGSVTGIGLLASLFVFALMALGACVAAVTRTQQQASFLHVSIMVPSLMMSGVVFPIEAMPHWLQPVAWSFPITYFNNAMRGFALKGNAIPDHAADLAALTAFGLGLTVLSLLRLRRKQR